MSLTLSLILNPLSLYFLRQRYLQCREDILDAVEDGGGVAAGVEQADQLILIVQHCRAAVAALAHRSGHQLVDEGGNLVGAVVDLHGDVDLLDGAGGEAGSAPAFFDCHIQGRFGNAADGADAQDFVDHIIRVHRFGNRAIHQVIRFDVAAGARGFERAFSTKGFQWGVSTGLYPVNYLGLEGDARWAFFDSGQLTDLRGALRLTYPDFPYASLRAGYRYIGIGDQKLHGPEVGLALTW